MSRPVLPGLLLVLLAAPAVAPGPSPALSFRFRSDSWERPNVHDFRLRARIPAGAVAPGFEPGRDGFWLVLGGLVLARSTPDGVGEVGSCRPFAGGFVHRSADGGVRIRVDLIRGMLDCRGRGRTLVTPSRRGRREPTELLLILGESGFRGLLPVDLADPRGSGREAGGLEPVPGETAPALPAGVRMLPVSGRESTGEAAHLIVRNREGFEALVADHWPGRPPPEVDFDREMVVAVFLGARGHPLHFVDLADLRDGPAGLRVTTVETRVAGALTPAMVVHPFGLWAVPRMEGAVDFVHWVEIRTFLNHR
jgi:hypothetical protein